MSEFVTVKDAAERIGVPGRELYRRIDLREIPAQRTERGRIVIRLEVVERLVAEAQSGR